jgi:hypothetical protein
LDKKWKNNSPSSWARICKRLRSLEIDSWTSGLTWALMSVGFRHRFRKDKSEVQTSLLKPVQKTFFSFYSRYPSMTSKVVSKAQWILKNYSIATVYM